MRRPQEGRGRGCSSAPPEAPAAYAPAVGEVDAALVASCIPVAAREHVLLERSEPEHRMITAAFFELMQTDELLARARPGRVRRGARRADPLDPGRGCALRGALQRQRRLEGRVKVLLTAGAPSSTGHDEEQTLAARARGDGRAGADPDAGRRQQRARLHGRLRPSVSAHVRRARRRDQHGGARDGRAPRPGRFSRPRRARAVRGRCSRRRRSSRSRRRARPSRFVPSLVGPIAGRREERISETPFVGRDA